MGKIVDVDQIVKIASGLKKKNQKIVLAGGCFDILHVGHIAFLEKAKAAGDILALLLESDSAIKFLKGEKRPINRQENRARVLSAIEFADFVVTLDRPFNTADYRKLVSEIKPDVIAVTEEDPNLSEKKSQAKEVGGMVKVVLKKVSDHSTTKLLEYF